MKGRKKWLIALMAAAVAVIEVAGPSPLAGLTQVVLEALLGGRPVVEE